MKGMRESNHPSFGEFLSTLSEEDYADMVKSDALHIVTVPKTQRMLKFNYSLQI